ncbi:MAG: hypothetical protein ACRDRZ_02995 [Pseudonocardiaceae bacterium]
MTADRPAWSSLEGGDPVTVPDPDEQDRHSAAGGTGPGGAGPDDTDAAFAEIVAGWREEPDVPRWPAEAEVTESAGPPARARDTHPADEEDHYVPPEPPPIPALRPRTVGGLLVIGLGVLLLFGPGVLGLAERIGTPVGLLALTGGIGWLVLGLRSGPPPGSGCDDGARL